jgi:hypothetical protein
VDVAMLPPRRIRVGVTIEAVPDAKRNWSVD